MKVNDKILQKIVSVSLPLSVLLTVSCFIPTIAGIIITILGTGISAPIIDKKLTQFKDKQDKNKIKEQHYIQ